MYIECRAPSIPTDIESCQCFKGNPTVSHTCAAPDFANEWCCADAGVFSLAVRNRIQLDFEAGRAVMVRGSGNASKENRKNGTLPLTVRLKATNKR